MKLNEPKLLSTFDVFDNIHLSNTKTGRKMTSKTNHFELADAISETYPEGKTPVFSCRIDEKGSHLGIASGIDFENSPVSCLDETENDYGLRADQFIISTIPLNTLRALKGDIQYFMKWASASNLVPTKTREIINRLTFPASKDLIMEIDKELRAIVLPITEETIIKFIFHHLEDMPLEIENVLLAGGWKRSRGSHSLATVKRRLVSLSIFHKTNNFPDPSNTPKIKDLLSAMAKTQENQKKSKAITKNILENILTTCNEKALIDIRDKALLLFGWSSGGRRRSEIADAIIENLEETVDGDFIYHISKSKTDQIGKGHDVPVKGKAAIALRDWIKESGIKQGKLFRSVSKGGRIGEKITEVDINRIVKKRCKMAGYDPKQYSAHSLRRGFITEAGKQGCPLGDTMAMSGHRSVNIAMGYYESGAVINNKAANLVD